ncbi:MAG TPA: YfhO family protein [Candidatus Lokiarchaeia archaeon]
MKKFFIKNRIYILVVVVFLILPWVFFNDSFKINSVIFANGDGNLIALPMRQLVMDSIKNFEPPFWNKYIFSGFPLFANPQASVFYPIVFILDLIFPLTISYNISILLHYSLFGIFLFFFLDEYKLNKLASFTGGLIFMFSGMIITHKGMPWILYAMVWCPLILLFLEKFRKTRNFGFVLVASIFYSFSFFGGNPQMFLYSSIIILLFIIYYTFIYKSISFYFLLSGLIFVFGFLLIIIQLIPTLELMRNSVRNTMAYGYFTSFSYDLRLIPTLFFPFLYGSGPSGIQYFGPWSRFEVVAYFGVSTMPFVIYGLFDKNKHKYFWIFIAIFSFLLVLGGTAPYYKLMYLVPLYNKFRCPTKHWFEFGMAFSILAGFGFNYFIEQINKKIKKSIITSIIFLGSIAAIFVIVSKFLIQKTDGNILYRLGLDPEQIKLLVENIKISSPSIFIPLAIFAATILLLVISLVKKNKIIYFLFILLIFFDLFTIRNYTEGNISKEYVYKSIEDTVDFKYLSSENESFRIYPHADFQSEDLRIYPNANTHYHLDIVTGYDPLPLSVYNSVTGLGYFKRDDVESLLKNNTILSVLNCKYIFCFKPSDKVQFFKDINVKTEYKIYWGKGDVLILENPNYIPRFSFVSNIIEVANVEDANKVLWEDSGSNIVESFDPRKTALVENPEFTNYSFDIKEAKLEVLQYKNNKIVLKTESPQGSYLVFSDTYYPGWKAYIDKIETKIYRTDGVIKGIYIPAGNHEIIFSFLPTNFWLGASVSFISYISIIIAISILFSKKRNLNKIYLNRKN